MKRILTLIFAVSLAIVLAACGGGGGGSGGCSGPSPGNCTALYTTAASSLQMSIGESRTFTIGGGTPSYSATSSGDSVKASVSGTTLSITAVTAGSASVLVTDSVGKTVKIDVTIGTGSKLYTTAPTTANLTVGATGQYTIGGGTGSYAVASSNNAVATVGISGNIFIINGVGNGTANVVVTDSAGSTVQIAVTVGGGGQSAALYTTAPNAISFPSGGAPNTFSVGGGQSPYAASSGDLTVASVSMIGTNLIVTPAGAGNTTIKVADAVGASVNISVAVSATSGGTIVLFTTAPTSGITLPLGATATYTVGGGAGGYVITSGNPGVVSVTQPSATNTFTVTAVGVGSTKVAVSDKSGAQVQIAVAVNSTALNLYSTAPTTGVTFAIGSGGSFSVGGGTAPYAVSAGNTTIATATISGTTLTINGVGQGSTTVTVTDAVGTQVNISVNVNNGSAGATALYTTMPVTGVTLAIGGQSTYSVGGGTAPYTATSSNSSVATVSNVSATNTFTVTAQTAGSANIVLIDATGKQVLSTFTVTSTTPVSLYTTAPASGVSFAVGAVGTFTVGGGNAPYTVASSNTSVATASLSGTTLTINAVSSGTANVSVTDSKGTQVVVPVTVSNVSSGATALYTTAPAAGVTLATGALATYTMGGGAAPYTVTSSNTNVVSVTNTATTFTITGGVAGTANIVVTDSSGKQLSLQVTVTASPAVTLYTTAPLSGVTFNVSASGTFTVGGGTSPYKTTTGNSQVATASIAGSTLTINAIGTGTTAIAVTDSAGAQVNINVTVSNGATVALYSSAPYTGITLTVGTSSVYTIGGGTPPYTLTSSNVSVATTTSPGSPYTITGVSAGTANIVITDGAGARLSIPFTVINGSNQSLTTLPSSAVGNVGNTLTFTVYGGAPPYTLNANNQTIAKLTGSSTVASSGGTFSVKLLATGTGIITVLDTNGVSQTLTIASNGTVAGLVLSPTSFVVGETSTATIPLLVSGGTAPYTAFVSNLQLASVSVSGSTVSVGLGSTGNRCISTTLPAYNSSSGQYAVNITVADANNLYASSVMYIQKGASCP